VAIRRIVEAFVAWTLSEGLIIVSGYAAGVAPRLPSAFVRWDSMHYLAIATSGYEFFSCGRLAGFDPTQWCGNAGWFPGYPLLIRILSTFYVDEVTAGFLISNIFYFGCLLLLREVIEQAAPKRNNTVCFLMSSVFPGAIFYHAVFPTSMLMFFALLSLLLLARGYYLWASLAAACGAFVYPTGFLLTGMVSAGVLAATKMPWPRRLAEAMLYGTISIAGLFAVLLIHQLLIGHWDAFLLVQAKYGHGVNNPLDTIWTIWGDFRSLRGNQEKIAEAAQSLLIGVSVLGLFGMLLMRIREAASVEWLAAVQVGVFWLFPLIVGRGVSLTRAEANLLPLVVLAAPLALEIQSLMLIAFAFLYFEVNVAFFKSILG